MDAGAIVLSATFGYAMRTEFGRPASMVPSAFRAIARDGVIRYRVAGPRLERTRPMPCPHCQSASTTEQEGRTAHGYRRFRCRDCERRYNERTGTVLNRVEVPSDIVFLVVFWRLRYKLSLRDLAEMFLLRGLGFTHEAVRDWEAKGLSVNRPDLTPAGNSESDVDEGDV